MTRILICVLCRDILFNSSQIKHPRKETRLYNANAGSFLPLLFFQTCGETVQCRKISCLVKNLEKHDQQIINVTIDIHEKSLAKTKVSTYSLSPDFIKKHTKKTTKNKKSSFVRRLIYLRNKDTQQMKI